MQGAGLIRREYLERIKGADPFRPDQPLVPTPRSRRGAIVARQRKDLSGGYFTERVFEIGPFPSIAPTASATLLRQVPSTKGKFVRLVAMRGLVQNTDAPPLTGLEPASLLLRMVLNGTDDLIVSQLGGSNFASFEMLFGRTLPGQYIQPPQLDASLSSDPWFWFAAPPCLRVGDRIQATVTNIAAFEGAPSLLPELALRLIDYDWYERLYLGRGEG